MSDVSSRISRLRNGRISRPPVGKHGIQKRFRFNDQAQRSEWQEWEKDAIFQGPWDWPDHRICFAASWVQHERSRPSRPKRAQNPDSCRAVRRQNPAMLSRRRVSRILLEPDVAHPVICSGIFKKNPLVFFCHGLKQGVWSRVALIVPAVMPPG